MKKFAVLQHASVCLAFLGWLPVLAFAGDSNIPHKRSPDQVLLLVNENSPVSKAIAQDYALKRHVKNILSVQCQDSALDPRDETMTLADYTPSIESPVRGFLAAHPNIDFIVLTKGIPIRITGAAMGSCDENSREPESIRGHPAVDSYLSALDYTNMPGALKIYMAGSGAIGCAYSNRYWNAKEPFSHAKFGGYLVTRLDGYTEADAKALTARSLAAEEDFARSRTQNKILLDVQPNFGLGDKATQPGPITSAHIVAESAWSEFNADMRHASEVLASRGLPVELDLTEIFVGQRSNVLGYFSWGCNDPNYSDHAYQTLFFAPGSISDTAVSTSARTFLRTQGGQSLLVDLIAHGLTCGKGYTDEPLLQAIASPTIALDRYTAGYTMAESFYAASHFVGWEDVVVGDPLCSPYLVTIPVGTKAVVRQPISPGVSAGADGTMIKDGKPFRAVGVNYFDCFLRTLQNGNDTSYETGFATLAAKGIPFVRFCATGFWPRDMKLYLTNRAEYFRRLDGVVKSAQQHGIGMVPSLFWFYATVPDVVGESMDKWGGPRSKTQAFMREYVREVVTRYRDNPAIWGWEFGNEYSLEASLPNAKEHRAPVHPELGTPRSRSKHDDLTFAMVEQAFAAFGHEVRKYDEHRLIVTGDGFPRPSAWHQQHERSWTTDTPDQFPEMLTEVNPTPMSAISLHLYQDNEARLEQAVQVARHLNKPLFVGEWGSPGITPEADAACRRQIKAICDSGVSLAALWVFDLASQEDFSVTAHNARSWQLDLIAQWNHAIGNQTDARPGGYKFDRTISRPVLENYLARSITMEGLLNGRGDLTDNTRMLKDIGAKYIGRALCLWGAESDFLHNVQRAKEEVPLVLAADPEMVLEACVFETVGPKVSQIAIPDWVFTALGQPVENRNFRYEDMIYPEGQRRAMGRNAQVPDESRMETQLWFYYQAASYIDCGCEGIHFGQVEIMNKNDRDNAHWEHLLTLVRAYAANHARRHMVLCNGHVPTGGLMRNGNPLLDFHAFPLRVMEVPDKPQEAILKVGFSDGIYGHSKGGLTVNGWSCENLPYLVELDNYGVSRHPGQPNTPGNFNWVWGYDEITWFAHQSRDYRSNWLQYAWGWVRQTDPNGYLEMPGSRTATSPDSRWYFANNPSQAVPTGLGDEDSIRAVWAADSTAAAAKN